MQNNISWRPQNKWGPPGLARWRWDLVHFREFFRILEKFLQHFWARSAREDTNSEHLQSKTAATGSAVSKKKWPTPRRVLDLIILGRLSKLFSKKLRAKRAPLRHLCETLSPRPSRLANKKVLKKSHKVSPRVFLKFWKYFFHCFETFLNKSFESLPRMIQSSTRLGGGQFFFF